MRDEAELVVDLAIISKSGGCINDSFHCGLCGDAMMGMLLRQY